MSTTGKKTNDRTHHVESHFQKEGFSNVACYQLSGFDYIMRLRIIDDRFRGRSRGEREDMIEPLIEKLDEDDRADITMLVLLAPGEEADSLANFEFERPSPSLL